MSKVRVHELAKGLNLQSKELINIITGLGVDVKSHMSILEGKDLEIVIGHFRKLESEKSKKEEQQQVIIYDFKRPNRVSKEQLRAIKGIHDKLARNLASQISSVMRSIVEIRLHSVDQMTYGEFLMSLPSPTSFNVFSIKPLDGNCVLEINPSIAFPMIDRLLGGNGEGF